MQTLGQLFAHELQDVLDAERTVATALETMQQCYSDRNLQTVLAAHLQETRSHVQQVRRMMDALGLQRTTHTCEGMAGIAREHDRFLHEQAPAPGVHAVYDVGAAMRAERYEIASYEQLWQLAQTLGYQGIAAELGMILREERQQVSRLSDVLASLLRRQPARQPAQTQGAPHGTGSETAAAGSATGQQWG